MQQKVSALVGIVGGAVDLAVGTLTLQQQAMPSEPMGMTGYGVSLVGYFLLGLGVIVLLSGLYMFTARMMKSRVPFGWLMTLYGVIMLFLGFGMITGVVAMMQGSIVSGGLMIFIGVVMLFGGFSMRRI